jgi:hypothetical protein
LYAFTWERSFGLTHDAGRVGMIVPVSSVCTQGFETLQNLLLRSGTSVVSNFNDRPSKLFDGLEHIRLCIILHEKGGIQQRTFSTTYNKWQSIERPHLFQRLSFVEATDINLQGAMAKVGSSLEVSLIQKLHKNSKLLGNYKDPHGRFKIYYTRKLSHFVQILDFVPLIKNGEGRKRNPSELKEIPFRKEVERDVFLGLLNSTLFYWFLTVYSDCRNLNRHEIVGMRFDLSEIAVELTNRLTGLTRKLMEDIRSKSKNLKMSYSNLGTLTIQCTYPKLSKNIIDQIDIELAQHYGFTHEELDFIINYDIKYRMGRTDHEGE